MKTLEVSLSVLIAVLAIPWAFAIAATVYYYILYRREMRRRAHQ